MNTQPPNPAVAWSNAKVGPLVLVRGIDRKDFLQRQITNDVELASPTQVVTSAMTNASARIQDVYEILELDEETLGILPGVSTAELTAEYLQSKAFFMDKVSIELSKEAYWVASLLGVSAPQTLDALWGLTDPPKDSPGDLKIVDGSAGAIRVWSGQSSRGLPHFRVAAQVNSGTNSSEQLEFRLPHPAPQEFDYLRILHGLPVPPNEIRSEYTPLEVNLRWTVSDNKGCYTGQEVLARQISYDKTVKSLVIVSSTESFAAGQTLFAGSRLVGTVTSAHAVSPALFIGLAVVRRPFNAGEVNLSIETEASNPSIRVEPVHPAT